MGAEASIYGLFDFCREYAPDLSLCEPKDESPDAIRLRNTLVCPVRPLKPSRSRKVQCTESIQSIVDDVIWSLVQTRSRQKTRNILSQGYVLESEQLSQTLDVRPCREMRSGVVCTHMNDTVSFWKTSSYSLMLHRLVGDDVLRTLLLDTYMFLPVEQDWRRPKQNYMLLCGPPLQVKRVNKKRGREESDETQGGRSGRKRSRMTIDTAAQPSPTVIKSTSLDANAILPRSSLFYSSAYVPTVGLSSTHILNQRPEKCQLLLLTLLGITKKERSRWKRVRSLGIPMCQEIFRRHSKCDYHRLLHRYCPLPDFCAESRDHAASTSSQPAASVTLSKAAAAYSSSNGVVSFLRAVLRQVFPLEFWGSDHNFEQVLAVTETFVKLRRQEQLPIKVLMKCIRVKEVRWVHGGKEDANHNKGASSWPKSLHEAATTRLTNALRWIFGEYIIPLLRSNFYVTESEFSAKRVLYYRKPVWSIFRALSMKKLLESQYKEISSEEAISLVLHQKMGLSRLRLLPKSTGVRALALLSKREFIENEKSHASYNSPIDGQVRSDDNESCETQPKRRKLDDTHPSRRDQKFGSTNMILRNVFEIFRYERERHPSLFGSGVFGLNEVYPKYKCFLETLRSLNPLSYGQQLPQLYFTSVDIKHCYDNIVQNHLLDILPKLLDEEEYLIQNSSVMHPFESMGRIIRKPSSRIGAPEAYCSFPDAVKELARNYSRSVFIESGRSSLVKREDVMRLLQEHLLNHIVVIRGRYGDRFLLQKTGIPQGSILSTLLCNYYYGDVEKAMLKDVLEKHNVTVSFVSSGGADGHITLLIRIVDDFLLVSTNKALSTDFLSTMNNGCDDLGVCINNDKTLVNYSVRLENDDGTVKEFQRCDAAAASDERSFFSWCGLLFDMLTGEVSVDYSRFGNEKATDSITVDRSGSEGVQLEIRMKSFVRPRCQPILFDSRINSNRTVLVNFCQAMLLCAVKTFSYIDELEARSLGSVLFVVNSIDDVISYTHKLIDDRLRHTYASAEDDRQSEETLFQLTSKDALWLGRKSFISVFQQVKKYNDIVDILAAKSRSRGDQQLLHEIFDLSIRQFNEQIQ